MDQAEQALRQAIAEIDRYLARFEIPGAVAVREGIARWRDGPYRPRPSCRLPANDLLPRALELLAADGETPLAAALAALDPHLAWIAYDRYPPQEIGAAFAEGHAYASLLGTASPIQAEDYDLGLFLIAPGVLYRDHRHAAPELYAPLTGPHGWRFAPAQPLTWKAAHQPVWNEAFQRHATRVGAVPFLCIYGWTRDVRHAATVIAADDWAALEREDPPA